METRFRLLVLRETKFLAATHDPVIAENTELIKIVSTIIQKARAALGVRS